MKKIPSECQEDISHPKILVKENASKITFLNPDKITVIKIKVDDCVIKKNDPLLRCDYILIPRNDIEIYVELKGCDVNHAVDQIKSTIKELSGDPAKLRKFCFIVSTRVPKQGTNIQKIQSQFKKELVVLKK